VLNGARLATATIEMLIVIDLGMAFGIGLHPTTCLALAPKPPRVRPHAPTAETLAAMRRPACRRAGNRIALAHEKN